MIDFAGMGSLLTGVASLVVALRVNYKVDTGNGNKKTIGQMTAAAEEHHQFVPQEQTGS